MKRSIASVIRANNNTLSRKASAAAIPAIAAVSTKRNISYNIISNNSRNNNNSGGYKISNAKSMTMRHSNSNVQSRSYSVIKISVPEMGDSISDGTLLKWEKKEGEYVQADETICQIETDKVVVEVKAPQAGVVKKLLASENETVAVGRELLEFDAGAEKSSATTSTTTTTAAAPTPEVEKEVEKPQTPPAAAPQQPKEVPRAPVGGVSSVSGEKRVPMSRMRSRIAQRLKDSQNTYAMLTTFNEVDMSKLMEMRSSHRKEFEEKHDLKLGFMGAFIKASSLALKNMPVINAVIDGEDIVYRDYVDVSVAVATPSGLVVPVIRNCENKSIADLERDLTELGKKGREGKITIQDMQGGTFTISNGGVFGSLMGTPIINPPQSAILGMHAINKRPVVVTNPETGKDEIVIRPMMYLALTYDHRLVDGREAVTFLREIKALIEDPQRMLLQ